MLQRLSSVPVDVSVPVQGMSVEVLVVSAASGAAGQVPAGSSAAGQT